jgi:hypothetical protein
LEYYRCFHLSIHYNLPHLIAVVECALENNRNTIDHMTNFRNNTYELCVIIGARNHLSASRVETFSYSAMSSELSTVLSAHVAISSKPAIAGHAGE